MNVLFHFILGSICIFLNVFVYSNELIQSEIIEPMINFNSSIYKHVPELNNFTFSASLKVDEVSEDIQELGEHLPEAGTAVPQKEKAFLSRQSIEARRKNPTVLPSDDKRGPSSTVGTQRRSETYQAAKEIHGADLNDNTPAYIGLF